MKLKFESRTWHTWVSLILALPIFVVAVTAVFIAHKKALATDEVAVAAEWLPGYAGQSSKTPRLEARTSLVTAAGEVYVGTPNGLYRLDGEAMLGIEPLAATQVRALAEVPWGRLAAAKNGVWLEQDGTWKRVLKGDAWGVSARPDGAALVALKDKGLLSSRDGQDWQPETELAAALAAAPATTAAEPLTLARLVMDLHTGKALFGKEAEWIWIDLVGLAMSLLALTGVYMWWRSQRRRAALQAG